MNKIEHLQKLLNSLHKIKFQNEYNFTTGIVPDFAKILGYSKTQFYFEVSIGTKKRKIADALISSARTNRPWLLIETNIPDKSGLMSKNFDLKMYRELANPEFIVYLTPIMLMIMPKNQKNDKVYDLKKLKKTEATEIFNLLKAPAVLPEDELLFPQIKNKKVDKTSYFKINKSKYSELFKLVINAKTNDEKKKSLENLSKYLFENFIFLKCKYQNLRTSSSEIDLVFEYQGHNKFNLFEEFGRYFLIECKNWKDPVGAPQIRDFIVKLQKTKVKLGIVIAKNGITGEKNGADALREIHSCYDKDDIYIIVISNEDLLAIEKGKDFYEIIDEKIDKLRFDL